MNLPARNGEAGVNGEVIYFDGGRGVGFAAGADGNRYVFDRGDLGALPTVAKGARIDFRADGDRAREIALRGGVHAPANPVAAPAPWGSSEANAESTALPATAAGGLPPAAQPATSLFGYFRRGLTRNYAQFRGRARRKEYWGFMLFATISILVIGAIAFAIGSAMGSNEAEEPAFTAIACGLVALALFIPSLAITIRRQHDIGLSGWLILLWFIPWVGALIVFVFTFMPSQKHDNRWGPVPDGVKL